MSNENSGNASKIIIGALVVALIGSWIYFSTSKTEIITNYTTQVNNLDITLIPCAREYPSGPVFRWQHFPLGTAFHL